jgi:hypothetical protein
MPVLVYLDSSVIRAHRVAAGAPRKGRDSSQNASQNALGRSRGGYSTKIHVVTDGRGLPLAITATPGQDGEAPEFPSKRPAKCVLTSLLISGFWTGEIDEESAAVCA